MLNEIDLARADLNLLVLFEAVLEERHVGRAAERLNLSASAVSHGLTRLRRMLNDPLFLKHPKGVVPTARADELAAPIADILARVRGVVGAAERFNPATSKRRFNMGVPDGASTVVLPKVIYALSCEAPGLNLSVRATMPQTALANLDAREIDVTVQPFHEPPPPRFESAVLYEESFVVAMRKGHPLGPRPSLKRYAAAAHVLMSPHGDPFGNIDQELAAHGLTRRVAVTAPNFLCALEIVSETDLVAAVPRRQAEAYASRFPVAFARPPLPLGRSNMRVIATKAAMQDPGVAWLFKLIEKSAKI